MPRFRPPDYLTEADEPRFRVRCPVHGFIHISENEREVIDHPVFQRLRFIRQLALTELLYPGATHTRFEHSLGVMHVASLAFDRLAVVNGDLLEEVFGEVELFHGHRPLAVARQALRLAGLLHDVGHAPFSHAAESIIYDGGGHEELTIRLLWEPIDVPGLKVGTGPSAKAVPLSCFLNKLFFDGIADVVYRIIQGQPDLPPQLQILKDIVSGEMDADRTDYLLRDSLHCGVGYGRFDHLRLIESLELVPGPLRSLEIAVNRGGIHAFEALILSRYQMNTQVYFHRVRRIYDLYLRQYFAAQATDMFDTPAKVLSHNDLTMMHAILLDAEREISPGRSWAIRIRDRHHHRTIHDTGERAKAADVSCSRNVYELLKREYESLDFQWDHTKPLVKIHKLFLPDDDDEIGEYAQLQVVGRDGACRHLAEESVILSKVPRVFQVSRIYCDIPSERNELRTEVTKRAHDEFVARRAQGGPT